MRDNPILYVIAPCYNEESCLYNSYEILRNKMNNMMADSSNSRISKESKLVFVDDGSLDETWNIISSIAAQDASVVGIKLAHNAGHQNALFAGLSFACEQSDCTITIDVDLQQDINAMDAFIISYKNGTDVVFGVRNSRNSDSLFKKWTALFFYSFMKCMGAETLKNHADYRLLSKKAGKALLSFKEQNLFLRGLVTKLGFKNDIVYFDVHERSLGESKYSTRKMLEFALDGITSFSVVPLRLVAFAGGIIGIITLGMLFFIIAAHLLHKTVPGWSSLLLSIWFLNGLVMLSLGVLGEYIGKLYFESKHRPRFIIDEILNDSLPCSAAEAKNGGADHV